MARDGIFWDPDMLPWTWSSGEMDPIEQTGVEIENSIKDEDHR